MTNEEMGQRLIALGRALMDGTATIREIARLAHAADMRFMYSFVPMDAPPNDTATATAASKSPEE